MEREFVPLHVHSTYSFLDGYGTAKQILKAAKELGHKACAVTDHGNISAWPSFVSAEKETQVRPIFGNEFYITQDVTLRGEMRAYNHVVALCKNQTGFQNFIYLVNFSHNEGFYYRPRISWRKLWEHREGIIISSACMTGFASVRRPYAQCLRWAIWMKKYFKDGFYLEIMPNAFPGQREHNLLMARLSKDTGVPIIITNDAHYPTPADEFYQDILLCINQNVPWSRKDTRRIKYDVKTLYLMDGYQIEEELKTLHPEDKSFLRQVLPEAIDNTVRIASECNAKFPVPKPPRFPFPKGFRSAMDYLVYQIKNAYQKGRCPHTPEYQERIRYELGLIYKKDYADYFLIVSDMVNWAKKKGILVGPARGSAAGSLAAYLAGITDVDPIRHGLMFERFIDITRTDPPDVDCDFEDEHREEVIQHLKDLYGEEHVSQLATFSNFRSHSCLRAIGDVFSIPKRAIDEICKYAFERSGGDARATFTLRDLFEMVPAAKEIVEEYPDLKFAAGLEGQVRHYGKHAAGVIVCPGNRLDTLFPKYETGVLALDGTSAADIGFMKIDVLGLNTLTIIHCCLDLIERNHGKKIDLLSIDLNDPLVYEEFKKVQLEGIFQLEGYAAKFIMRRSPPRNFEELSHANALSRPGPLHSGGAEKYFLLKEHPERITYLHPCLERITKDTFGVILFQEQVMRCVLEIGKFSWAQVVETRKTMSKSKGVETFNQLWKVFREGAKSQGIKEEDAKKIWDSICTFGSWAFNKSHSVSYSVLSFWCAWLKHYYPLEFYSALTMKCSGEHRVVRGIAEFKLKGGELIWPGLNRSKVGFTSLGKNSLVVGFKNLKGIGEKAAEAIVAGQPYTGIKDFMERRVKRIVNKRVLQVLIDLRIIPPVEGLFPKYDQEEARFNYCPFERILQLANYRKKKRDAVPLNEVQFCGHNEPVTIFVVLKEITFRNPKVEERIADGAVVEVERRKQRDKFIVLKVEDDTDSMVAIVSGRRHDDLLPKIVKAKSGSVVLIHGRAVPDRTLISVDEFKLLRI